MDEPRLAEIHALVEPILADRQMELVELTTRPQAGQQLIRLLVDKIGGVTVEQCAQVNRRIGEALETANLIEGSYTVEVSSPGLDRVIKKGKDFDRFAGKVVHLRLKLPDAGQRNFKGVLRGLRDGKVVLDVEGKERSFELSLVDETRIDAATEAEKEL